MATEEYRGKRNFGKTPEPKPGRPREKGERVFVVHRHEARSLHYDLRIQADGVLACWAVPKGFSYAPATRGLPCARRTTRLTTTISRDRSPRDSTAPARCGSGTRGSTWCGNRPTIAAALEKGELKLELKGRRLRGEWHLVRTKADDGKELAPLQGARPLRRLRQRPVRRRRHEPGACEAESRAASPAWSDRTVHGPFDDPGWLFEPLLPAGACSRGSRIPGSPCASRHGRPCAAPAA